jgi:hypothetical protein
LFLRPFGWVVAGLTHGRAMEKLAAPPYWRGTFVWLKQERP